MYISFVKCHGTGNDFILIDEISRDYGFTVEQRSELAIELCRRDGKIGADGILFVRKSEVCDAKMTIINADGSEPEMCGNGLRCVGRYVTELLDKDQVVIETLKSSYGVNRTEDIYEGVKCISIVLESISFELESLPMVFKDKKELFMERVEELDEELEFSAVSMTNPHIVAFVDKIDDNQLSSVGRKASVNKSLFPRGVNVNFVKLLGNDMIYVRTFERGVGLTKSCGTGMVASSITFCRYDNSNFDKEIKVCNAGGMIKCLVRVTNGSFSVRMTGNATYDYRSAVEFNFNEKSAAVFEPEVLFTAESKAYDRFLDYTRSLV